MDEKKMTKDEFDNIKYIKLPSMVDQFARHIAPVYEVLQWKWAFTGVPNAIDITVCLNELIRRLDYNHTPVHEEWFCSTGGLKVFIKNKGEYGIDFSASHTVHGEDKASGRVYQNRFYRV